MPTSTGATSPTTEIQEGRADVRILIVEDQRVVARDLQNRLQRLGYTVPAIASSRDEAVKMAEEVKPHLVLMDIQMNGPTDGIEAAQQIHDRFSIPVVYLTGYRDEETFQQAKVTEPFGYLLKPVEDREMQIVVEIALYRHRMELSLGERNEQLDRRLREISRLNSMFQQHLALRYEAEEKYQKLKERHQRLREAIQAFTKEMQQLAEG